MTIHWIWFPDKNFLVKRLVQLVISSNWPQPYTMKTDLIITWILFLILKSYVIRSWCRWSILTSFMVKKSVRILEAYWKFSRMPHLFTQNQTEIESNLFCRSVLTLHVRCSAEPFLLWSMLLEVKSWEVLWRHTFLYLVFSLCGILTLWYCDTLVLWHWWFNLRYFDLQPFVSCLTLNLMVQQLFSYTRRDFLYTVGFLYLFISGIFSLWYIDSLVLRHFSTLTLMI